MTLDQHARTWLDRPELSRLWDGLHARLQNNGLQVRGRLSLDEVTDEERTELGLLMNRPYDGIRVSIGLPELDARLPQGLIATVRELRGPLTDRRADRAAVRGSREQVWAIAQERLAGTGLADKPWAEPWLAELRKAGSLSRFSPEDAVLLLDQAFAVLSALAGPPSQIGRHELAERVTGTSHGLDDGTLLSRVVLRALARVHGTEVPRDARARRELWTLAGAPPDTVSATVLTYGLHPAGNDLAARTLRARSGTETHLTARDLRTACWSLPAGLCVHICENPRVLEAAAEAQVSHPLVCTSGNANTTVLALLDILAGHGAELVFRGDFDWPGIAMTGRLINRYGARAWRMAAVDYEGQIATARERGTPLNPLAGPPLDTPWDPELTASMRALGVAVEEESALELLLSDLA